jgi:hypothetical protein
MPDAGCQMLVKKTKLTSGIKHLTSFMRCWGKEQLRRAFIARAHTFVKMPLKAVDVAARHAVGNYLRGLVIA